MHDGMPNLRFLSLTLLALFLWANGVVCVAEQTKNPPALEHHWVVLMELGEKAPEIDQDQEIQLKRGHLRYMSDLEEKGFLRISSGFRVHEDERHRELAFYRGDLKREQVEEMASGSPIVKSGLWKPYVYIWTTIQGEVSFGGSDD